MFTPREPWRPFHGGAKALPLTKTQHDREARELWDDVVKRQKHVQDVEQAAKDAVEAVQAAHRALEAEVKRAADAGEVSSLDAQLLQKREQLMAEAAPEIHEQRKRRAGEHYQQAEEDYLRFLAAHSLDFVAELTPEAKKVSEEYVRVYEEMAARLRPIERRYAEIRDAVTLALGGDSRFRPDDLPEPQDFRRPPLPSEESIERAREAA